MERRTLWLLANLLFACAELTAQREGPTFSPSFPDAYLGGPATVFDTSPNAFSFPAAILDAKQRRAFVVGNAFFKDNWITAPASAAGRDGLGPLFNARSCSSCHLRDGRGRPPRPGESNNTGLLLRLGVRRPDAPDAPHPVYGGQLQEHAVAGIAPEGTFHIVHEERTGAFEDGKPFSLEYPRYVIEDLADGPLGRDVTIGPRVAPQLIGLGLLESLDEATILARADPEDVDGDGISGRPHWVTTRRGGERRLGRFGWKATQPTLEEQTAAAFVNDIGITSPLFEDEAPTAAQRERFSFHQGGHPEIDEHKLARVTFYGQVLAVPAQREPGDPSVLEGRRRFEQLGCARCHVPTSRTGSTAVIPAFADRVIHPYTDLLLHDMGEDLADEKRDGDARPEEWRTPPLWGIGLFETVNGHTRYLHDGRARSLEEAILWHGGEAQTAKQAYLDSERGDREALLAFLRSL